MKSAVRELFLSVFDCLFERAFRFATGLQLFRMNSDQSQTVSTANVEQVVHTESVLQIVGVEKNFAKNSFERKSD